jgi:hypothetical protein
VGTGQRRPGVVPAVAVGAAARSSALALGAAVRRALAREGGAAQQQRFQPSRAFLPSPPPPLITPSHLPAMFARALPALRAAAARPSMARAAVPTLGARRGYAEAVSDKLTLQLILPHAVSVRELVCLRRCKRRREERSAGKR